jgi:hypothetical protein
MTNKLTRNSLVYADIKFKTFKAKVVDVDDTHCSVRQVDEDGEPFGNCMWLLASDCSLIVSNAYETPVHTYTPKAEPVTLRQDPKDKPDHWINNKE